MASDPNALSAYAANKGTFDVQFEAPGQPEHRALRPRSVLVQLEHRGDMSTRGTPVVAKEIEMRGTFLFHEEFALALDLINAGRVDLKPLMSGTFSISDAVAAFEAAGDRSHSIKIHLSFT